MLGNTGFSKSLLKGASGVSKLAKLFLDSQVFADRNMSLLQDARAAGTKHVEDLTKKSSYSRKTKSLHTAFPNARDLLRRLVKRSARPPLYYAKTRKSL